MNTFKFLIAFICSLFFSCNTICLCHKSYKTETRTIVKPKKELLNIFLSIYKDSIVFSDSFNYRKELKSDHKKGYNSVKFTNNYSEVIFISSPATFCGRINYVFGLDDKEGNNFFDELDLKRELIKHAVQPPPCRKNDVIKIYPNDSYEAIYYSLEEPSFGKCKYGEVYSYYYKFTGDIFNCKKEKISDDSPLLSNKIKINIE